tara:strand:- start:7927 stop:8664 length:738 start_codon:yes stop_codon:yes gene_type:complete
LPDEIQLGKKIESFRSEIKKIDKPISSYGSPRSGSPLFDTNGVVLPGILKKGYSHNLAKTGTNVFGGVQLKKIIELVQQPYVLELGTNTGLSGCYILSALTQPHLTTIEGSPDLCEIADSNLSRVSDQYDIRNEMFQDSINYFTSADKKFDIIFIDGQHEEKATLLYADLVKPICNDFSILIFDDIYWSEGMNNAWKKIVSSDSFSLTIDLGTRGIAILDNSLSTKEHFSVTRFTGKPLFNRPGW